MLDLTSSCRWTKVSGVRGGGDSFRRHAGRKLHHHTRVLAFLHLPSRLLCPSLCYLFASFSLAVASRHACTTACSGSMRGGGAGERLLVAEDEPTESTEITAFDEQRAHACREGYGQPGAHAGGTRRPRQCRHLATREVCNGKKIQCCLS